MKKEAKYSTHHIVAKHEWWSNVDDNLIEIKHNCHQALHTLFTTDLLPDKIKKLIGVEYSALRSEVVQKLLDVLEDIWNDPHDRYKNNCFRY